MAATSTTPEARTADLAFDKTATERYVIVDRPEDLYRLRDTVEHVWLTSQDSVDMTYMEAHDLREEYRCS
jgi:hypothetical protein